MFGCFIKKHGQSYLKRNHTLGDDPMALGLDPVKAQLVWKPGPSTGSVVAKH